MTGSPITEAGDPNPNYPCADPNPYTGVNPARQERAWGDDIVNLQICKIRFKCTIEWYKIRDDGIRGVEDVKRTEECNELTALEKENASD